MTTNSDLKWNKEKNTVFASSSSASFNPPSERQLDGVTALPRDSSLLFWQSMVKDLHIVSKGSDKWLQKCIKGLFPVSDICLINKAQTLLVDKIMLIIILCHKLHGIALGRKKFVLFIYVQEKRPCKSQCHCNDLLRMRMTGGIKQQQQQVSTYTTQLLIKCPMASLPPAKIVSFECNVDILQ